MYTWPAENPITSTLTDNLFSHFGSIAYSRRLYSLCCHLATKGDFMHSGATRKQLHSHKAKSCSRQAKLHSLSCVHLYCLLVTL